MTSVMSLCYRTKDLDFSRVYIAICFLQPEGASVYSRSPEAAMGEPSLLLPVPHSSSQSVFRKDLILPLSTAAKYRSIVLS